MLVLSRKLNEAVVLGDEVVVRVTRIDAEEVDIVIERLGSEGHATVILPRSRSYPESEPDETHSIQLSGGECCPVVCVDICPGKVRLGFGVSRYSSIYRHELYDAIVQARNSNG